MATMIKFFGQSKCGCIGCKDGITGPAPRATYKSRKNKHGNSYGKNAVSGKR